MRLVGIYYSPKLQEINLTFIENECIIVDFEKDNLFLHENELKDDWWKLYFIEQEFKLIGYFMEEV
jgi:hypothetical protein